ncbi:MAG: PKD domain-containing protein, partial [Sphingobacteriales bacterium]
TLPTNSIILNGSGTDVDGTIASYNWVKLTGGVANIVSANTASSNVSGLVQGNYTFQLTVRDNSGATATDVVNVTVLAAPNVPPTANAGNDITITLPTNSIILNGSGTDVDGTISSYNWVKLTGGVANIVSANTASSNVSGLVQGNYTFQLTVRDNSGASATDVVNVTVLAAPNVPPTANAGNDITITLPTNSIILNGSGTDVDGTISSYNWVKLTGGAANIVSANTASSNVSGLVQGSYTFQLTVRDNSGATATDVVNVTVLPAPNVAPMVNAGTDQVITIPINQVTLTGSAIDADGSIASYAWVKMSGPAAFISDASLSTTNVLGLSEGVYTFRLTVRDNSGATASDEVQVTVVRNANILPVANAGADIEVYVPVSTANLSGSATDADGIVLTYNWIKITGPAGGFISNALSASTQITALVPGEYTYQLVVIDNDGAVDRDTMKVSVLEATGNMAPVVNAGPDLTVLTPISTVELQGSATDHDGEVVSYRWKIVSGPGRIAMVGEHNSSVMFHFLQPGVYTVVLQAWDNLGAVGTDTMLLYVNSTQVTQELPKDFIRIFPNPVGPRLSIHLRTYHQGRRVKYLVVDMYGRPMAENTVTLNQFININQVNVAHLAPGWYTLKIISEGYPTVSLPLLKR